VTKDVARTEGWSGGQQVVLAELAQGVEALLQQPPGKGQAGAVAAGPFGAFCLRLEPVLHLGRIDATRRSRCGTAGTALLLDPVLDYRGPFDLHVDVLEVEGRGKSVKQGLAAAEDHRRDDDGELISSNPRSALVASAGRRKQ
jgi:hypothetical protein